MKVLIADDEIKVCRLIQHLVDWDALEMDIIGIANDGKTAYESICEKKPDIVITDIRMPVYDGLELIRRAKEVNPDINFIVISGYSQFEYAQQAIKYGVKDYLLKPLKKRELENALSEIKESHESLVKSTRIRNEMESIIEASREHIRENFLLKVLQNTSSNPLKSDMSLTQLNEQYGCKFKEGYFTAVRVRPFFSETQDKSVGGSEEFVMNKIHQMVKEKLETLCETYMSTIYQDEIVCILNTTNGDIEAVKKKLKHLIVNVSNLKTVFPDLRIRIGQGNTYDSYMKIADSFQEAELALLNRMDNGDDVYIRYSRECQSGKTKEDILDSTIRNEILTHQERMDIDGTLKLIDRLKEKLLPYKYDGKLVYEVFIELVETLRFGMKYYRECRGFFLTEDYKKKYRMIWDYEQLFQWIKLDLSRIHQVHMKNIQDEESKPIRDAKKYIHDNFNKHISLENVSDYIGFNAAYFSTLFKKETGKNFLEYVTELRIQKAKNYLMQTNYDIAEVASAVGYNDLKYFSKLFKKTTGLSPSEFRKLYG